MTPSFHTSVKRSENNTETRHYFWLCLELQSIKNRPKPKWGVLLKGQKKALYDILQIFWRFPWHVSQKKFCSRKHFIWLSTWQMEKCLCLQSSDGKHFWFRTLVLNIFVYTKWPFVWESLGTIIFAKGFSYCLNVKLFIDVWQQSVALRFKGNEGLLNYGTRLPPSWSQNTYAGWIGRGQESWGQPWEVFLLPQSSFRSKSQGL